MTGLLDETHDPAARSWVPAANEPGCDFPLQNLPLGMFRRRDTGRISAGTAIGDQIYDLRELVGELASLNPVMSWPAAKRRELRRQISAQLREGSKERPDLLTPMTDAEMLLPALIGDYSDFYASVFHATNVGKLFRPDQPLLPNYKYVPIGYHGRASSVVLSGTPVRRPSGQRKSPNGVVEFGPTQALDYELELGCFVGPSNALGEPVPIAAAADQLVGVCLLNDWSARDIQSWEYQPLGPFLAKSFATSISPWVVTMEALAPFRVPAFTRPEGDPAPLPYLLDPDDQAQGGFGITVEVWLQTARMQEPVRLSQSSVRDLYWTLAQMTAHHTSNGCNLRAGDLLGTGTISGPEPEARGCLLELTERGQKPVALPSSGETRAFLEPGDEVILRGYAERDGFRRIGLGECRGRCTD